MRSLSLVLLLTVCTATAAVSQGRGSNPSVRRPNSSNFGWQDRQNQTGGARQEYAAALAGLSEAEWREAALAMMEFESSDKDLLFTDVVRIGAAVADKKAVTERGEYYREDSPSWVVRFGKKTPKTLTLTLTDPRSTQVECTVGELLEIEEGYVGVFLVDAVLMCVTRSADVG
ncbi:MAG: hypothetical protein O7A98_04125 [Acidobacteria bacterium]|nr:hypothetical protein [Acidobacteriota bacterium]